MFVEIVRLIIVICSTAGGYQVAHQRTMLHPSSAWPVLGALIGACVGYVVGGVLGRTLLRGFTKLESQVERAPASHVLVGGLGAITGACVAVGLSVPLFFVLGWQWAYPVAALLVWVIGTLFYRLTSRKAEDLLALAGLSSRPLVRATRYGDEEAEHEAHLLDTSAVIDGRLLEVVRAGFIRGALLIPRFVLDELQGIADAGEQTRRRRGRRGLEVLDALRTEPRVQVHVLDDEVPEFHEVDAKLASLARRLQCDVVTTDFNLQRVAEVQGVTILNLNGLAAAMKPIHIPGESLRLKMERKGTEAEQGVGFLEDGTMVVVEDAAHLVGESVEVKVVSTLQTGVGRMLFAQVQSERPATRRGSRASLA
jgi:uncharacterized protein YacL